MATPPRQERRRLVDLLVGAGLLDRADVPRAMALVKQTGGHLLRVIVDEGWVDEDRLIRALSSALGVEAVTPSTMKIHERVLSLVPARLAIRHRALPIAIKRANQTDYLYVAIGDPLDLEAVDDIQRASGCRINVLIAPPTQLDAAIARHYGTAQETPSNGLPTASTAAGAPPPLASSASSADRRRPGASSPPAAISRTPAPWPPRPGGPPPAVGTDPRATDQRGTDPRGATAVSGPPVGLPAPTPSGSGLGLPAPLGVPTTPSGTLRPQSAGTARPPRVGAMLPPASVPPAAALRAPLAPPPAASTGRAALQAPSLPAFPSIDDAWSRSAGFRPPDTHDAKTQLDTNLLELAAENLHPQETVRGLPTFVRSEPATRVSEPPSRPSTSGTSRPSAPTAEAAAPSEPHEVVSDEPVWDVEIDEVPEGDGTGLKNNAGLQLVRGVPSEVEEDHPVELQEVVDDSVDLEPETGEFDLSSASEPDFVAALAAAVSEDMSARPTALLAPRERESASVGSQLPTTIGPVHASVVARTMEVPVALDDVPSPFDGMRDASVRAGLELTGIIPALDWEAEGFDPPITRGTPSPALVGSDDIPSSPSAVKARLEPLLDEAVAAVEEAPRRAEEARESRRAEEARRAEERRSEEKRIEERRAADERRAVEEKRAEDKRAEDKRAEDKRAEEARRAEERRAEEKRAEEARRAEERRAEEKRVEEARRAEERRVEEARRAEEKRAEEKRAEEKRAEEARRAEERRVEEKRAEERRAEEARRADERRAEETRRIEEARRLEERRAEEKRAEEKRAEDARRIEEARRARAAAADEETQARVDGAPIEEVAVPGTDPRRETPEEPVTNPRIAATFVSLPTPIAMDVGDDLAPSPVEKVVGPWEVTPANDRMPTFASPPPRPAVVDPAAQELVGSLMGGRSLNSAQRAQLILAIGRVLLSKGIISADELALALASEGDAG